WTIPIAFPADEETALGLRIGRPAALVNEGGGIVGSLEVHDVYPYEKERYLERVYGTRRTDHPGGRMVMGDPRTYLVGGEVRVLPPPGHPEFGQYVLTPRQTRALFRELGWQRAIAFQTRNPLHRAHEDALVVGLERLTREGHRAGAVLNPLVGETKGDD